MSNLVTNIGHIVTALVVDVIVMVLAIRGVITGDTAVTTIVGVSAFSLGGSVASSSGGTPTPVSASAPVSLGAPTTTASPTSSVVTSTVMPGDPSASSTAL